LGWKNSLQTSPLFVAERVAMHSLFFITSCWRSQKKHGYSVVSPRRRPSRNAGRLSI
jgi:hypothetical protein